jgi:hypothetical protein
LHTIEEMQTMSWPAALGAGLTGALTLTLVHESARRLRSDAPRMDVLGVRALRRPLRVVRARAPRPEALAAWALVGDLVANTLYYAGAVAAAPRHPWLGGGLGGAVAALGALLLPPALGLGEPPSADRTSTQTMTVAWYLLGGLATAAAFRALAGRPRT